MISQQQILIFVYLYKYLKMMKNIIRKTFILVFAAIVSACSERNPAAVTEMLDRIGGDGTAERIEATLSPSLSKDGEETFVIGKKNGKPHIKGSSLSSLTAGIGWYLNHYAHINISWNNLTEDLSAVDFPLPQKTEKRTSSAMHRYYLNYCTFSYSMAFWEKERWQQEIDWMALHGINMPLMLVGSDVVWRNMLKEVGYGEDEIAEFVAGPGFQAWWLMNNLEGWGGPNPEWWYERQENLCRFILEKMRGLGMEPVLPGYSGMLPSNAGERMGADVSDPGHWCAAFQRPSFLLPTDGRFEETAEMYYRHLEAVMGKSRYYSMDPFHEGGSTEGVDVKAAYSEIYTQMKAHSPESRWVIQSWQENPRKEALEAVPEGGYLILDLFSDGSPKWADGYEGHDFLWCMLHNFGGRTGMHGRLESTMGGYFDALEKYPEDMKGIGATPEGIETNPILYDALFELPWMEKDECSGWIDRYVTARYGISDSSMTEGWKLLASSVLNCPTAQQGVSEPVVCARPSLEVRSVSEWSTCAIYHDTGKVRNAASLMLKEKESLRDNLNYGHDIVDVVRQALTDSSSVLLAQIEESWKKGDRKEFRKGYEAFLEMIEDMDRLLSTSGLFTLDRWIESARGVCDEIEGTTEKDRDWMEWNARTLISVWGPEGAAEQGHLHDYSNRQWAGMLKGFYYPRWERFFKALEDGKPVPDSSEWFSIEEAWTHEKGRSETYEENPADVAEELYMKYFSL